VRSRSVFLPLFVLVCFLLAAERAKADCSSLVADSHAMSAKAQAVQTNENEGQENEAKAAWNDLNHYALVGAHAFNSCDDTASRLSYSVTFADATAIGMHYGMLPWSEGANDIGASLQIIDALPHSAAVKKEWDLVDRLYVQACGMHDTSCAKRTY
jgi:hypothetical protein